MSRPAPEKLTAPVGDGPAAGREPGEIDLWWGCFSGRVLVPQLAACGAATLMLFGLALYLGTLDRLPLVVVRVGFEVLAGGLWLFQLLRWAYRLATLNYRLTTRHLFLQVGPFYRRARAVPLARVVGLKVEQGPLQHRLGVGNVRLELDGNEPPVVLVGMRHPHGIAEKIEAAIKQARDQDSRAC